MQYITKFEYQRRVKSGMYIDVDLGVPDDPEFSKSTQANDKIEGKKWEDNEDGLRTVYESYILYKNGMARKVPTGNLQVSLDAGLSGRTYAVLMAAGVLTDTATTPNAFAGLSGTDYTFTVSNEVAPVVLTFAPANGATNVNRADPIVVTFSENIQLAAGMFFVITPAVSGPVLTIATTDATQVAVSGAELTITPTGGLPSGASGQEYRVEMATGTVRDLSVPSNAFVGLFSRMYVFTVADDTAPVLVAPSSSA